MACDMPEPCRFPSLNSGQKKFLWTHKEADLAPNPVASLVLQVGAAEKFPQALGFESLDPNLKVSKQGTCFTSDVPNHPAKPVLGVEEDPTLQSLD